MKVFGSNSIARGYIRQKDLQKPEKTILSVLGNELASMRMLDVGVGAGRTTWSFAPLVKEYTGIDYSKAMIEACQKVFQFHPQVTFKVLDARFLTDFKDNFFDFVLFSFNGIDYVDYEGRAKILMETRRVTKHGGQFCFSSHNLNNVRRLIRLDLSRRLPELFLEPGRFLQFRWHNRKLWKELKQATVKKDYLVLNDGAHGFKLKTFYASPAWQISQLNKIGFCNVRAFDLAKGDELDPTELCSNQDPWLYYLCNVRK